MTIFREARDPFLRFPVPGFQPYPGRSTCCSAFSVDPAPQPVIRFATAAPPPMQLHSRRCSLQRCRRNDWAPKTAGLESQPRSSALAPAMSRRHHNTPQPLAPSSALPSVTTAPSATSPLPPRSRLRGNVPDSVEFLSLFVVITTTRIQTRDQPGRRGSRGRGAQAAATVTGLPRDPGGPARSNM